MDMPKEPLKITGFRIDPEVHAKLKQIAKDLDRSVNWVVNDVLKLFVETKPKTK